MLEMAAAGVAIGGWRSGLIWADLHLRFDRLTSVFGDLGLLPRLEEAGGSGPGMAVVVSSSVGGAGRLDTAASWGSVDAGENRALTSVRVGDGGVYTPLP